MDKLELRQLHPEPEDDGWEAYWEQVCQQADDYVARHVVRDQYGNPKHIGDQE